MYDDRIKQILEEVREAEFKEELHKKYYNLMGTLLFKQEFLDALNNRRKNDYFFLIMRMNVLDTH
ncbi:MAG: hypothetical protein ACYDEI_08375 [Erysipelotrichaceae bacterium]